MGNVDTEENRKAYATENVQADFQPRDMTISQYVKYKKDDCKLQDSIHNIP